MHVLKVFSGTKTQFLCNKDSFFLDVADEDTATMLLGEIAESEVTVVLMNAVMIFCSLTMIIFGIERIKNTVSSSFLMDL